MGKDSVFSCCGVDQIEYLLMRKAESVNKLSRSGRFSAMTRLKRPCLNCLGIIDHLDMVELGLMKCCFVLT